MNKSTAKTSTTTSTGTARGPRSNKAAAATVLCRRKVLSCTIQLVE
ncbi:hypothetical protein [Halobacillus halophilus]|nr:hypothetical protein [Halobacillus halophilus]